MASLASPSPGLQVTATNHQRQSPLFGLIPAEIRNEIFSLALIQFDDESEAYPEDSYWYRPGFSAPHKSSSSLLRTCKLAYLEGHLVFLQKSEWAFWFDRGPQDRTGREVCRNFFKSLTPQQSQQLDRVRFFTQMYWLEGGQNLRSIFCQPNFRPTSLTITIRYSDWWHWESNARLRMSEDWLRDFVGPSSLRELRVEYETLDWKRGEMMKIVLRNKTWKLAVDGQDNGHLSAEATPLDDFMWTGTSRLGNQKWTHHGDGDTVQYVVVTDTWKFVEGPVGDLKAKKQALVYDSGSDDSDGDWSGDEDQTEDYEEWSEIEEE